MQLGHVGASLCSEEFLQQREQEGGRSGEIQLPSLGPNHVRSALGFTRKTDAQR